uniref:CxC3 like cysteine cluster domain-containing protein n=1 Tax=Daphnia galeata TaxID=27404 RepID=A0A8J2RNF6_9CRUS|nr:unnamed protein product [Daphnia galeata]
MEILQPDHFIDTEGNIITKSMRMFVSHASNLINAEMLTAVDLCQLFKILPNQSEATIDDYVFSGYSSASLSTTVTYLFSEEALLLGHHISQKCPGCSKNMYAYTLEDVSKEYGRNGPINVSLLTTSEREWETFRPYIYKQLRSLASAGKARKSQKVFDDVESKFGNLVIKSDVEVENFRQRIYNKVKTSKKKNMCGESAFQAAREDSHEQKKYDETGIVNRKV